MDEPGSPSRVEIELTPNDESRLRRRKSSGDDGVETAGRDYSHAASHRPPAAGTQLVADDQPPASSTIERRQLVVAGVVVAIVALFVGWALGRSGGSSAGEEAQPATTAATTATAPGETPPLAVVPPTAPATVSVTTRPRVRAGPTTTTLPEWETTTVAVDPAAAALDIEIVMAGGTTVAELHTATGELRTLSTNRVSLGFGYQLRVNAGADWIVIRNLENGTAQLLRDGERLEAVDVGDVWSAHFQPETGLYWVLPSSYTGGGPIGMLEIDHEGNPTGRSFDMPPNIWPIAADPAGGVVADAPGGTYQLGPDGARRVTTGSLLALSPRIAVVIDCGDDFVACGLYVVDRATGVSKEVPFSDPQLGLLDGLFDLQSAAYWGSPELMGAISPDDRWAPIMVANTRQQFGLLDLTTGEFVRLGGSPPSALWWSPDGHVAIYNEGSRLTLFDAEQRTTTDITPPGVGAGGFAVRPTA